MQACCPPSLIAIVTPHLQNIHSVILLQGRGSWNQQTAVMAVRFLIFEHLLCSEYPLCYSPWRKKLTKSVDSGNDCHCQIFDICKVIDICVFLLVTSYVSDCCQVSGAWGQGHRGPVQRVHGAHCQTGREWRHSLRLQRVQPHGGLQWSRHHDRLPTDGVHVAHKCTDVGVIFHTLLIKLWNGVGKEGIGCLNISVSGFVWMMWTTPPFVTKSDTVVYHPSLVCCLWGQGLSDWVRAHSAKIWMFLLYLLSCFYVCN